VLTKYYQPDTIYLISGGINKSLDILQWVPIVVSNVTEAYATEVTVSEGIIGIIHSNKEALMMTIVYGFASSDSYGHPEGINNSLRGE